MREEGEEEERTMGDSSEESVPSISTTEVAVLQWRRAAESVVHGRSLHPHEASEKPSCDA